jgi:hypothetical protein
MLKRLWLRQEERLDAMCQMESRTGMLLPNGYKEIEASRNIIAEIAKINLGNNLLRDKGTLNNFGLLLAGTVTPQPDDLAVFKSFDMVDRNLARAAIERVIHMAREGRSGRLASTGVGEYSGNQPLRTGQS